MTQLHDRIATVTERIRSRSHDRRQAYLEDIAAMEESPDSCLLYTSDAADD